MALGLGLLTAAAALTVGPLFSEAQSAEELRQKMEDRENRIQKLRSEISSYESELREIDQETQSLENTLKQLRVTQDKLRSEIEVAENRIEVKNDSIASLEREVQTIENKLDTHHQAIADTLRRINEENDTSTVEAFLKFKTIAEFWSRMDSLERLQDQIQIRMDQLDRLRQDLVDKQQEEREARQELEKLRNELTARNQILEQNKRQNQRLLNQTQSEEAAYQQLLAERKRQKEQFERELRQFEAKLDIQIDPGKIPEAGTRALRYPLRDVSLRSCWDGGAGSDHCVTQYFGHTDFSTRTSAYKGKGHNGVDFRANIGDEVLAAGGGTVKATGNTDAVPGCYSYGKWVLLEHQNGLSTLYAHLSHLAATPGQSVDTGQIIGYSGNSGYSTGPHLHFTVYATEGVQVMRYKNSNNCQSAEIPIADLDAYIDPLQYL